MRRLWALMVALGVLGGLIVAIGCADMHRPPSPPVVLPEMPAQPPPPTVGASSTSCSDLQVTLGAGDEGMNHSAQAVVFTNRGRTCTITGYPGVVALAAGGGASGDARPTTNGFLGGLHTGAAPVVRLAQGEQASALVEGLIVGSTGSATCPWYTAMRVTPPGGRRATTLTWSPGPLGLCDMQVHPVLPGTAGSG